MTADELALIDKLLDRVKVGGPLPMRFYRAPSAVPGNAVIMARMISQPLPTDLPTPSCSLAPLEHSVSYGEVVKRVEQVTEALIWRLARKLYNHELAEWYSVDGKRIRDPHSPNSFDGKLDVPYIWEKETK